ncbi:MAG: exo-alpha-sialidase [Lentisphaeria bacterium]|nr:exo-alpha-sialidase [Lentisphaeria bacterium]
MKRHLAIVLLLVGVCQLRADDSGLEWREFPSLVESAWHQCDFRSCQPRTLMKRRLPEGGTEWLVDAPGAERPEDGYWLLREPAWTPWLLTAKGAPGELTYDPKRTGVFDIVFNLRAVDPVCAFGVRLDDESKFDIVRTSPTTRERNFNEDVLWRRNVRLDGRKLVFKTVGERLYLQGVTFLPQGHKPARRRVATDRVTVARAAGRHHAFPGIARLADGTLAVVYRDGVAHVCPFGRILMVRSKDQGRTWSKPQVLIDTPSDERDPSIHTLPDGRVMVTFNTWNSWMSHPNLRAKYAEQTARIEQDGLRAYTGRWMMLSNDDGQTWDKPFRVSGFAPHGPMVLDSGEFRYPSCRTRGDRRQVIIWHGSAGGREWKVGSIVGDCFWNPKRRNAVVTYEEPFLAIVGNGDWLTAVRVPHDGYIRVVRSTDEGKTWNRADKLSVRGFPQHLLTLRDKRLLMVYGYRYVPFGIRAVVSLDHGTTWNLDDEMVLAFDAPFSDVGYPVSVELDDGRVLTVYYTNADKPEACFIQAAIYRP